MSSDRESRDEMGPDGNHPLGSIDEEIDEETNEEIVVPIEDELDLHPFRPNEIRSVVESYLDAALERGFVEVRLIHGKGIGVQRENVRGVLEKHPEVLDYRDGELGSGSWGATIARLRRRII